MKNMQLLRKKCFNQAVFPAEILTWIKKENLWNLWVPKKYGGLEASFSEGLQKLKDLAFIDGSLGWTITLCSGANYFIGNLDKEVADEIFLSETPPILGGSGGVFGTAEIIDKGYRLSGKWQYATGAPYLSHFTLNAKIINHGKEELEIDGTPKIRSFVIPQKKVKVISDWNTMGLIPTATHSFEVDTEIEKKYSFLYNHFNLPQDIFKIPFSLFADMTLWVNYVGMGEHFLDEAHKFLPKERIDNLAELIALSNTQIVEFSEIIENTIKEGKDFTEEYMQKVHTAAADSVREFSRLIIEMYPLLGIKASSKNQQLNQIFRDYFTGTQHHIFSK